MANAKISALTAASAITGAELVPIVQSSTTKRTTIGDVVALAVASVPTPGVPNDVGSGTYLVSGGAIGWDSALTYRVGAASYYVNGVACTSPEQTVTLSAADGSNPRIDVLVLNAAGTLSATAGTAAANPAEPTVDPELYLRLGIVLVPTGATEPLITQTNIYTENGAEGWTTAVSAGTITAAGASNPRTGSVVVDGTAVAANTYITFTKPAAGTQDMSVENNLIFFVRVKSAWPTTKSFRLGWYSGTALRGVSVTVSNGLYGFNSATTGSYQQIAVPISAFSIPSGNTITNLRITVVGGGTTVGFYIDDIKLNSGSTIIPSLTASRALVSSVAGTVAASTVTATELGYVSGVTSAIQTQMNTKGPTTVGKHAVPIMAGAMTPSATGGCAALATVASAANQPDITTLDFDATTQEYAQFSIPMPSSWDEGTVTFVPVWSHGATDTNFGVVWDLQAIALSNDDVMTQAFGTAVTSTDTGGTTNDVYVGPESAAITIAGTPATSDVVFFRLSRVTGNGSDTMAVDARLHGITLFITTAAAVDV